ncbi:MAG TPA: hypothetical protein VIQ49_09690 [Williamsia sp.]
MTAAMGATVGAGAGHAAWYDPIVNLLPIESCEGGSGTVNANVDCQWSIDPPVTALLPALGVDLDLNSAATAREDVDITLVPDWLDWFDVIPDLEIGGTTAKITGPGLAYANSLFAAPGSSAEAHAWGFLSGAVAVTLPPDSIDDLIAMEPGHTKAISLPLGVTIAAAGSGQATAIALGGFATAVGFTDLVENVSCMALVSYASHSNVGTCAGVLFIFSVSQVAGSPEYVFAIADPTSLTFLSDQGLIPLPIPSFDRDILRVGVGGSSGIRVETDLFETPNSTSTSVSTRTAAAPAVHTVGSNSAEDASAEDVSTIADMQAATEYVGKHRAPDTTETETTTTDTTLTDTTTTTTETETETDTAEPETDAEPDAKSVPESTTGAPDAA